MARLDSSPSPSSSHESGAPHPPSPHDTSPKKRTSSFTDEDGRPTRTGNSWTASAHIITAVIGSGVLSLPWSMAQLGWIAGPVALLAFAIVTYFTSLLLCDCYRSPDPVTGKRNYTYMDAVRTNLGSFQLWLCGLTQYSNLYGTAIGYTITAGISMVAVQRSDCYHKEGKNAPCDASNNLFMVMFGVVQILLSQIPDFNRLWWLSVVATIMSFSYSLIGLGLSIGMALEPGHSYGTIDGVGINSGVSESMKVWTVLQALGDIAFAYSYSMILIEIQDTLKSPPPENQSMKRATLLSVGTTTVFYMLSGGVGYVAFGNSAPGNILTGFGFYNPYWLVDFANVCVVIHLAGAYQVYCQPLFAFVECSVGRWYTKSRFVHKEYALQLPIYGVYSLNLFRLVWRTGFVISTTLLAMILPFFNDVLGILGATGFWPLTVYFPIEMYIVQRNVKRWSRQWIVLQTVSILSLLVSIAALIGSVEGVVEDLKLYKPFKMQ